MLLRFIQSYTYNGHAKINHIRILLNKNLTNDKTAGKSFILLADEKKLSYFGNNFPARCRSMCILFLSSNKKDNKTEISSKFHCKEYIFTIFISIKS